VRSILLALAAAFLALPTGHALVTDTFWYAAEVSGLDVDVAGACHATDATGTGAVGQSWTDWFEWHAVLATTCGALPLDFNAERDTMDHLTVGGPSETHLATGDCLMDWERGGMTCMVHEGALTVSGWFGFGLEIL
jgi:hypothetical protein